MKKRVLAIAAVAACAFAFNACEEGQTMGILGNIELTVNEPVNGWLGLTQPYTDGQTLSFGSSVCNVNIDSLVNGDDIDIVAGTIMVGTTGNVLTNDVANLTYPMCAFNLTDTIATSYEISCPIDQLDFYEYIDETDVNSLITTGLMIGDELRNMFAVAVSEDGYYLGYDGTISISTYAGRNYQRVVGTVNNVNAVYITREQLAALIAMPENERPTDLSTYLPHTTFTGTFTSVRANIDVLMEALEESETNGDTSK